LTIRKQPRNALLAATQIQQRPGRSRGPRRFCHGPARVPYRSAVVTRFAIRPGARSAPGPARPSSRRRRRKSDGPPEFLKGYTGYVQADAANLYDRLFGNAEGASEDAAAKEVG
jgi:hypothetical protein